LSQDPDKKAEVLRLHMIEQMSARAIARQLGMSRKTVGIILGRLPPPSSRPPKQLPSSILDPFDDLIRKKLEECPEIKAPAVLEHLRAQGYTGGITVLRDRLRAIRPREQKAFLTPHFAPGSAMQVDWGDFGFPLSSTPRRVSALVAVLAYSRMMYIEFTLSQKLPSFLRAMTRAMEFFGGATEADVFDNMKTVVVERHRNKARFHGTFVDFAAHYGFAITACTPRSPHEKGRVERGIGFVRQRFWPGRRFRDLFDLNRQAADWTRRFANARTHEATGKVPGLLFESEERPALRPLPATRFVTDDVETQVATKMCRIRFDRNEYSVPWRLVGQRLTVRANDTSVQIFLGPKVVARHARCWSLHQDIEDPKHRRELLEARPRADATHLPDTLLVLGEVGRRYFELLTAQSRSLQREALQLVRLTELFPPSAVRAAMERVLQSGHVGCDVIEHELVHRDRLRPKSGLVRLGNDLDQLTVPEPSLDAFEHFDLDNEPEGDA